MIQNLVSHAVVTARIQQFFHIINIQIGYTPSSDQAFFNQFLHAINCFFKRHITPPMQ